MKKLTQLSLTLITLALTNLGRSIQAQGLPPASSPEEVGLASDKLDNITLELKEWINKEQIAGAVGLIAKDGKIAYRQAVGFSDLENNILMVEDNIFRIASNTKIITGFAVHLLVEDGLINLNDPVSQYIPSFADMEVLVRDSLNDPNYTTIPAQNLITIDQLLNHTSGINYNLNNDPIIFPLLQDNNISDGYSTTEGTIGEMVDRLSNVPLAFEPGTEFLYGLNSDVLGRVVEVASGKPLDKFLEEEIFDPLEMNDTGFLVEDNQVDRLARLYTPDGSGGLEVVGEVTRELSPGVFADEAYPYTTGITYFSGGAGLSSTPDDFVRFFFTNVT